MSSPPSISADVGQSAPPCVALTEESERTDLAKWFRDEVQPHESVLRKWLRSRFPRVGDLDDIVQEAYSRLFRAQRAGKVRQAKNYLFATARNAALDLVRHENVIPMDPLEDNSEVAVLSEGAGVAETVGRSQELEILREAMAQLPPRCRQVFTLRKLYGLTHTEISTQLGISPKTVEVHVNNAMRLCAAFLRARGLP